MMYIIVWLTMSGYDLLECHLQLQKKLVKDKSSSTSNDLHQEHTGYCCHLQYAADQSESWWPGALHAVIQYRW